MTATTATTATDAAAPETRTRRRAIRRARRFARLWGSMEESVDRAAKPAKERLFTGLPARLVELGPGRGVNFAYFPPGTSVLALEPNGFFHDHLRSAAEERGIELDLRDTTLAAAGLDDGSQDCVLSSFVLCSVADRDAELREISRVLRPGGVLLFVEHVAAPRGSVRGMLQRVVRRPWQALGDGCDPHPDTVAALERSGLQLTEATFEPLGSTLDLTNTTYWGRATKV